MIVCVKYDLRAEYDCACGIWLCVWNMIVYVEYDLRVEYDCACGILLCVEYDCAWNMIVRV